MRKLLPIVALAMLAACACNEGQCPKDSTAKAAAMGQCEHCTTGKGECTCGKDKH